MGILGALSTSVSGLSAQSYALENISGNIANASTIGFKRVDTTFVDLIPDQPSRQELAGSVSAHSQLTNTLQGTLSNTGVASNVAISGQGFFVVAQNNGSAQSPSFSQQNLFTRRGDFSQDSNGYLVNGSGYFLSGTTYDPTTGAAVGVSPSPIAISKSALAAQKTETVAYSGNLPSLPKPTNYTGVSGTELLPGATAGTAGTAYAPPATAATAPANTYNIAFTLNGLTKTTSLAGPVTSPASAGDNLAAVLTKLNTAAGSNIFSDNGSGQIVVNANATVVLNAATKTALGFASAPAVTYPTTYAGAQAAEFVSSSISGGQVTVYSPSGTAANLQLRWAKTDSATVGGTDTWQLFYQKDSSSAATTAWTAAGAPLQFDANGKTSVSSVALGTVAVGGVPIGNVSLSLSGGMTQYGDSTGAASVSLDQDGYSSGTLTSISIGTDGSISGSYSNGQAKKLGELAIAQFSASDLLKRENGGAYSATTESGNPTLTKGSATISGGALEASNTDISSEFSKMIVTQQAYSANTKVMSTAQQMLQDIINVIR